MLKERTGVGVAGVIPWFDDIHIPEEDSLGLAAGELAAVRQMTAKISTSRWSDFRDIANFDDFDPFMGESRVRLRFITDLNDLGAPDLIILPGSKTTVADLEWMRESGIADEVISRRRKGTPVIGICGGYQMLGERILDPEGVESAVPESQGLGLLPLATTFAATKTTHQVRGRVAVSNGLLSGCDGGVITGYEIHMGRTYGAKEAPFSVIERSGSAVDSPDGAMDADGLIIRHVHARPVPQPQPAPHPAHEPGSA